MGDNGTVWLPEGASTLSPEIDALFYFIYWASFILFVGVVGAMVYFAFRYRRRDPEERPAPIQENRALELSWIVIPTILVLVIFFWGFQGFVALHVIPAEAYEIQVRARKWGWTFQYPNGAVSAGELHVPANRPVKLLMSSEDVLHSLFIPAFRVKQDVLPNRYTSLWFEATKVDTFQVSCTEYCGTLHSGMLARVIVHTQGNFNRTINDLIPVGDDPVELGRRVFENNTCNACHSLDGSAGVGPSMQDLFGREEQLADGTTVTVDENYLRESILQPNARIVQGYPPSMPNIFSGLSAADLDALIAFIRAQSAAGAAQAAVPSPAPAQVPDEEPPVVDEPAEVPAEEPPPAEQPAADPVAAAAGGDVARGQTLYQTQTCIACHSLDGAAGVGPSFQGILGREVQLADGTTVVADEAYLRESILQPNAKVVQGYMPSMPAIFGALTAQQLDDLIAFLSAQ